MGALGSDVASLMAIVAASGVVVDEGGLVLQLVEAGSGADGGMGRRRTKRPRSQSWSWERRQSSMRSASSWRGFSLSSRVMGSTQRAWNLGSRGAPELSRWVFR
jgi:hypothetical protein